MSITDIKFTIAEILKTPLEKLTYSTHLHKDLGLDSMDVAELTVEIENRLSIRISDDHIAQLATVQDIIAEVRNSQPYVADEYAN